MKQVHGLIIGLMLVSWSQAILAQERLTIVAPQVTGLIEAEQKGPLVNFVNALVERTGHVPDIRVLPSRRGKVEFDQGSVDAMMPIQERSMGLFAEGTVRTLPVMFRRDFIFVKKGSVVLSSLAELEGRRVGIAGEYSNMPALLDNPEISLVSAKSLENLLKMLDTNHVDAIVMDEFAITALSRKYGIDVAHEPDKPVYVGAAALVFSAEEGAVWVPRLNPMIETMWRDRSVLEYMPHAIIEDFEGFMALQEKDKS